ncbi:MAG: class Ib ribonucleoside-diphosphate reductase assembly flavoprotein NrdI [Acholeplasmataceae bacterium]|nr:MAG: class Ib ribonucleoside-diphosphate reductase assembly flavoprotein NrdI [Acholeplasmataceae bacterium]
MIVVYDSLTGQGKRFADKLGYPVEDIRTFETKADTPLLLITRSFNFGEVTREAAAFLDCYHHLVIGVAVTGNRNWGANFGAAGDKIAVTYGIPLVLKFEASGMPEDVTKVKQWLDRHHHSNTHQRSDHHGHVQNHG